MTSKYLTVFTPTYNRAHLLEKCYQSLLGQEDDNFLWLIIDDGSNDYTEKLVNRWINECEKFEIRYIRKENGGLHTAYNTAIDHMDTELCVCCDSDDYMSPGSIKEIVNFWKRNKSSDLAGIIGLDCLQDGSILGDLLPDIKTINLIDLLAGKYLINNGDRKLVIRTDLFKSVYPQPSYEGEKNFNPHYMHLQISMTHDFLVLNKPLCIVDYQSDGMSSNMYRQYFNSPKSFMKIRELYLSFSNTPLSFRIRNSIHYFSSAFISSDLKRAMKNKNAKLKPLTVVLGYFLSLRIRSKNKRV